MFNLSREKKNLLSLEFLFLLGMWTSKTVWPLWFHESGDLRLYGVSYAAMAVTGIFSLAIGPTIQNWGTSSAYLIGIPLYGMGIALRWFNQSLSLAILSGVVGGLGASAVLLAIRTTARDLQGKAADVEFIAIRKMLGNVGLGAGGIFAAILLAKGGFARAVFGGVGPLILAWILGFPASKVLHPEKGPVSTGKTFGLREILNEPGIRNLLVLSCVSGIFTSLIVPYLPILLSERGLSSAKISLLGTIATLAAFLAQPIGLKITRLFGKRVAFFGGEAVFLIAVALLLAIDSFYWVPFLVGVRVIGRSVSSLAEEMWEVERVSSAIAASYYGAAQTAFLVGDSLGGALGGLIVARSGIRAAIGLGLTLTLLHAFGWLGTVLKQEKRVSVPWKLKPMPKTINPYRQSPEWKGALLHVEKLSTFQPHTVVAYTAPHLSIQRRGIRRPRKVVIHLHGGPESCEKGEARYGSVFPNLVTDQCLYIGWNYPGSTELGSRWKNLPRKRWNKVLIREWRKLKRWIQSNYSYSVVLTSV